MPRTHRSRGRVIENVPADEAPLDYLEPEDGAEEFGPVGCCGWLALASILLSALFVLRMFAVLLLKIIGD